MLIHTLTPCFTFVSRTLRSDLYPFIAAMLSTSVSLFLGVLVYRQTDKLSAIDKRIAEANVKYSTFNYLSIKSVTLKKEITNTTPLELPCPPESEIHDGEIVMEYENGYSSDSKLYHHLGITIEGDASGNVPINRVEIDELIFKINGYSYYSILD